MNLEEKLEEKEKKKKILHVKTRLLQKKKVRIIKKKFI